MVTLRGAQVTDPPTILVITDYPIVARTARCIFDRRYRVIDWRWAEAGERAVPPVDIVIADITTRDAQVALTLVWGQREDVRVLTCSLHCNEVEVYRRQDGSWCRERAFPNLLSVAA
jgi:hypothetical protein